MFILPPVHEIVMVGMFDAGVPNKERIVLRPTETLNLAAFGLLLSQPSAGGVTPLPDHFFWFGEKWINPPAWIVVFTGPGAYQEGTAAGDGQPVIELHWGKPNVLLHLPGLAISIVRLSGIASHHVPGTTGGEAQRLFPSQGAG